MIKLICTNCHKIWYTANTKPNQRCSDCGELLTEVNLYPASDEVDNNKTEKTYNSKVIKLEDYLNVKL